MPLSSLLVLSLAVSLPEKPKHIEPDGRTATSRAVLVPSGPLAHTSQFLPLDEKGKLVGKGDVGKQVDRVLDLLLLALAQAKSSPDLLVKLNVTVADPESVEVLTKAMVRRFPASARPALAYVAGSLPHPDALIALDAVAQTSMNSEAAVSHLTLRELDGQPGGARLAVLPQGSRVYISGQAEPGDLETATKKTLDSLDKTLKALRLTKAHVVQVKAFLMPMKEVGVVEKEIAAFFPKEKTPPLVLVEWKSGATTPIEIELVAWAGKEVPSAPDVLDYLTPLNMKASPVFSRVSRIHYGPTIYLSGLHAEKGGLSPKEEVANLFTQLKAVLKKSGSDLHHLAKATYYVVNDGTSKALNELRPNYYDPKRPPAASKAIVSGVGMKDRTITLDMIAVPTLKVPTSPPEVGHGLNAKEAAEGWIALYDGQSTFGWKDGAVEKGVLDRGTSMSRFGNCSLKADAVQGGILKVGGKEHVLKQGAFSLEATGVAGPIELAKGLQLRSLAVKPLGLKTIFNGRDLDGWKRIDRQTIPEESRPIWKVEKGVVVATGGPGALEYQGAKYGDMVLQIDIRTRTRHANGGVFIRSIPGDFMNGYEAQVYNRCVEGDPSKPVLWATGAIDDRQNARRLVSRDFETYRMTVIARGPHLATWINGHQVTEWTDTRAPDANPRKGVRLEPGTLQLQAHDPLTDVEFRSVLISE